MPEKITKYNFNFQEAHRMSWLLLLLPVYLFILLVTSFGSTYQWMEVFSHTAFATLYAEHIVDSQVLIMAVALGVMFFCRLYFQLSDFIRYPKIMGYKLSINYLLVFPASIFLFVISFLLFGGLIGLVIFGFTDMSLAQAVGFIFSIKDRCLLLVQDIPTLIELPRPIAALTIYLLWSLLLYGFHRLSHESRLMWLLAHRPHHLATSISVFTAFDADQDFVLGFLWKTLWLIIPMIASKLIYPEPIVLEFVLLLSIWGCFDALNHQSTYYQSLLSKDGFIRKCHRFFLTGPYHVLHHSALLEHQKVNICSHFFLWDKLFGTFCEPPKKLPPLGLTHQPLLYLTPFRIVFSGLLQIIFELKYNKSWAVKWRVLFAGIDYVPPKSKSYLIADEAQQGVQQHRISRLDASA